FLLPRQLSSMRRPSAGGRCGIAREQVLHLAGGLPDDGPTDGWLVEVFGSAVRHLELEPLGEGRGTAEVPGDRLLGGRLASLGNGPRARDERVDHVQAKDI